MAELYEIYEGQEKLLASSIRDVDELIKEIMQLDANQFRQILMIPQNEFRKLLTSDSKDKELILQRLFHTEYYQLIQNRLKDEAKRLRELVERSLQDRTLLLKSIEPRRVDELSLLVKDETLHDIKILFLLQEEIKEESNFLKYRKAELSQLHQKRDNINTKLVEAEALLDQFKEKEHLEEKYKIIQSKELEMARKEEQLQKGRKVQLLQPQEQFCLRLKEDLHLLHEQKGEKHTLMIQQQKNVEMAKVELDEQIHNEDSRNEIEKKFHYLQNLKEDVYAISSTKKEVNDAMKHHRIIQKELKQQQEELDKVTTKIEEIEKVIKSLDEYQRAKMRIENRIEKKRYEYRELRTMNDLLLKQNEISKLVNQRTLELNASRKQVEDKEATLKFLQEKWRDSHAYQLAQSLVAGEACPVCGSTQHPLKSMAKKEMVNQEDLKQAELEVQEFQKLTLEAEREFTKTSTLYDSICDQVKDKEEVLEGIIDQYTLIDTEILLESAVSAGKELDGKVKRN
ncbi:hypothetical protein [Bacillus coahuilensis]|uniref:hypothetical protein n=2 Tax=Bacillus coahuilensis TaxID=408580 RepID=UPI0007504002|nr:hypothetical protein [Bacillus coahuilensis]